MPFGSTSKVILLRLICDLCLTIASAALTLLPSGVSAQGVSDTLSPTPGLHDLILPRTGAPPIRYATFIPVNYSPSAPVPLILALHFGVGGADPAGAGLDVLRVLVAPALAELGAIIVAPDSIKGNWSTPENEKSVHTLLDLASKHYSIDQRKVIVTGFSMGGGGSWHVAEKFPGRFSAALPVAGRPPVSAAGWRLPVLAVHSRDDQVSPIGPTETRIAELQTAGVNAKLIPLTGIQHQQMDRFRDGLRQAVPWLLHDVWK